MRSRRHTLHSVKEMHSSNRRCHTGSVQHALHNTTQHNCNAMLCYASNTRQRMVMRDMERHSWDGLEYLVLPWLTEDESSRSLLIPHTTHIVLHQTTPQYNIIQCNTTQYNTVQCSARLVTFVLLLLLVVHVPVVLSEHSGHLVDLV